MMHEALADAIVEYVSSQYGYGGMFSDVVRAYVTDVSVTQEVDGLATIDVRVKLASTGKPKPKPKSKSPWVSIKSRLPDVDETVLVCRGDDVSVGACDEDGTFVKPDSLATFKPQPTHWQPLPAGVG